MAAVLVVVHPFEKYGIGDLVCDEADIEAVVNGAHVDRAVRVLLLTSTEDRTEDN